MRLGQHCALICLLSLTVIMAAVHVYLRRDLRRLELGEFLEFRGFYELGALQFV